MLTFFIISSTKSNVVETDVELHNSDRININPSGSTLTISLVEKPDEGTYQCTADNLGGIAKASAKLTVSSISKFKLSWYALLAMTSLHHIFCL